MIVLMIRFSEKAGTEVQCPVEEGEYVVEQTVALPKEIPRGMNLVNSFTSFWLSDVTLL